MNKIPALSEGEIYIGCYSLSNILIHVILLPGDSDDASWEDQMAWAVSVGGDLPNRIEQALLWRKCPGQFKQDAYWSNETYSAEEPDWSWQMYFGNGNTDYDHKRKKFRARAVRRVLVEMGGE